MGLVEYKKKRSFKNTPEPTGGKSSGERLQFVIQKHDARRLHYDFRLELKGVLKSWAVPKGPSLNPADKRLAMLVEDHPFDYKNFEGIIPEGNYGAGTVIVWDEGYYEPVEEADDKKDQEKILMRDFEKGSMKIRMHGQKLRGEFALVRLKGKDNNSWLLIKHRDEYASKEVDILEEDASVKSGKTIEDMAKDSDAAEWKSNRKTTAKKSAKRKPLTRKNTKAPSHEASDENHSTSHAAKRKAVMPQDVEPMLATLATKPKDDADWIYEIKWDGFRSISYINRGDVAIRSRNNKDFNKKFYPLHEALQKWDVSVVVDGEIIVMNKNGMPDFNALQEWRSEADGQLVYYLFDILWLDGYDLTKVPLRERKEILKRITPTEGMVRFSDSFDIGGDEFFEHVKNMRLEGMMAKKADSLYAAGTRSKDWLKIKTENHQEVVIAGFTQNEDSPKPFSALLMGVYEKGKLVHKGAVGTGFNVKQQRELLEKMKPLHTTKCPFQHTPDFNKPSRFRPNPPKASVTWLKPEMVAEVSYRAIGNDGAIRHPSFRGLREDKKAKEVVWEEPSDSNSLAGSASVFDKHLQAEETNHRKTLLNPTDETQTRNLDGHDLKFTNLSKIFWPEENVSKRDMLNYYYQIAPYMVRYMKDRPQTLNRFPNGIYCKSFYQKDVTGKVPGWIHTYAYFSEGDQREKHFLVCTDEASLLYIASLGCIEINPWSSRTESPDHPDWCIIDLDPGKKTSFNQVIDAALVTKEVLDAIKVPSWCKTSGSTGLHIYIPLGAKYTYEESKEFARPLVTFIQKQLPAFTSIERKVSDRQGKMYLDFLQNRPQATVAGPYSLRPKPGAPVSMPLHWDEVKKGLSIKDYNIKNAVNRVRSEGDLFEGVLGEGIDMKKALDQLKLIASVSDNME